MNRKKTFCLLVCVHSISTGICRKSILKVKTTVAFISFRFMGVGLRYNIRPTNQPKRERKYKSKICFFPPYLFTHKSFRHNSPYPFGSIPFWTEHETLWTELFQSNNKLNLQGNRTVHHVVYVTYVSHVDILLLFRFLQL